MQQEEVQAQGAQDEALEESQEELPPGQKVLRDFFERAKGPSGNFGPTTTSDAPAQTTPTAAASTAALRPPAEALASVHSLKLHINVVVII